jgi:hypothetical protein
VTKRSKRQGHYIQKKLKEEKALLSGKSNIKIIDIDDINALPFIVPIYVFVSQRDFTHLSSM